MESSVYNNNCVYLQNYNYKDKYRHMQVGRRKRWN